MSVGNSVAAEPARRVLLAAPRIESETSARRGRGGGREISLGKSHQRILLVPTLRSEEVRQVRKYTGVFYPAEYKTSRAHGRPRMMTF